MDYVVENKRYITLYEMYGDGNIELDAYDDEQFKMMMDICLEMDKLRGLAGRNDTLELKELRWVGNKRWTE